MEIKGKVVQVLEVQKGTSAKGEWKKQLFIVEIPGDYPKMVAIDVFNEKVNIPVVGSEVVVDVNIESREFNGKWYTNIQAWKIASGGGNITDAPSEGDTDDLPY